MSLSQNFQTGELGPATIIDHQFVLNGEHFTIQAAQPTLLVRSEVFAPGWKARIDNMSTEVMRADCTLQSVFVPAGKHDIEFYYLPDIYPVAVVVSSVSLIVVTVYALALLFSMFSAFSK